MFRPNQVVQANQPPIYATNQLTTTGKTYELTNHLGNVLSVISDRKQRVITTNNMDNTNLVLALFLVCLLALFSCVEIEAAKNTKGCEICETAATDSYNFSCTKFPFDYRLIDSNLTDYLNIKYYQKNSGKEHVDGYNYYISINSIRGDSEAYYIPCLLNGIRSFPNDYNIEDVEYFNDIYPSDNFYLFGQFVDCLNKYLIFEKNISADELLFAVLPISFNIEITSNFVYSQPRILKLLESKGIKFTTPSKKIYQIKVGEVYSELIFFSGESNEILAFVIPPKQDENRN